MNRTVLVLGAGMVAPPVVRSLLERENLRVLVADCDRDKAAALVGGSPRGEVLGLNLEDTPRIKPHIERADLVISLLPFNYHSRVAELCIEAGTDLITASYSSPQMKALEDRIKQAGILVLNEVGLDPGIDHMEAMRVIHEVQGQGGRILAFTSFCGGLPAPEANTNPLGYKFSWSPQGVLAASKSPARYLWEGKEVNVTPEDLFLRPRAMSISEIGELEGYPNRDSLPYISLYGIPSVRTMLRGTLRYKGWCAFMQAAGRLGFLNDTVSLPEGKTYRQLVKRSLGVSEDLENYVDRLKDYLGEELYKKAVPLLMWLGLDENRPVPPGADTSLQALALLLQEKLQFEDGERDMVVLRHQFDAAFPEGGEERIVSTLIDYGIPRGDSAMARTVGLPVAVAAELVLERRLGTLEGLHIPISADIYRPVLDRLRTLDISFQETRSRL
jgi:saccharopine dehydrogenase (NADP+, L-glutamate forming)